MKNRTMVWLIIGFGLTGCSAISDQAPDVMVRQAIQRNITRDNQYNFKGQLHIRLEENNDQLAIQSRTNKTSVIDDLESNNLYSVKQGQNGTNDSRHNALKKNQNANVRVIAHAEDEDEKKDLNASHNSAATKFIDSISKNSSIRFTGAVDIPKGKVELNPELRYEAPNIYSSVKIPMQLDVRNKLWIVDIAAFKPTVNLFLSMLNPSEVSDKTYLSGNISSKFYDKYYAKQLVQALPKAIDIGLSNLSKNNFVRLTMDKQGHEVGASYRIRLISNEKQNRLFFNAVMQSIGEQLMQAELAKNTDNDVSDNSLKEEFADLHRVIELAGKDFTEEIQKNGFKIDMNTDFYLDGKGRLLAIKQIDSFFSKRLNDLVVNKKLDATLWMQFEYTSNPKFILKPATDNTLYLNSLRDLISN
jgi:hypothetical protein